MLIGKHGQEVPGLQVFVEVGTETLLELVGLARGLALRLDERLDREQVDLDLGLVVHRRPHGWRGEVVRGDDHRLEAHGSQQALAMTRREVVLGLLQDGLARCHDHKVPHPVGGDQQFHRPDEDIGLANACRRVDHSLERRLVLLHVVVLRYRGVDGPNGLSIGRAKIQPNRDLRQSVVKYSQLTHQAPPSLSAAGGKDRRSRSGRS